MFRLDVESWRASIMLHGGKWITLRLLHGKYHDRFKGDGAWRGAAGVEGGW